VTGDFYESTAANLHEGDFLYMDPPYAMANERIGNQYGASVFGTNDLARLGKLAKLCDKKGGYFVISYAKCDEIAPLASNWCVHEVLVHRTIAANSAFRRTASELLITNLAPSA
jgi:DNA adenine methylase